MANLPRLRSITQPAKELRDKLESRTGINNWASDSAARTITDALAASIVNNHNETVNAFEQIQISTANGNNLDEIALSHGLARYQPRKAYSSITERSVYFYVAVGTFGDINSGADIVLPAGTKLFPSEGDSNSIVYETLTSYTLGASQNLVYCAVRAVSFGSSQNVGPRSLTSHSMSEFPNLYCTNKYAIVNGRGRETDENLRDRISVYFRTLSANNRSALLMEALSVPGVLDLSISEGYYGMGTCGVFVFGADGFSSRDLLRQVAVRASSISTAGLDVVVSSGVQVAIGFDIEVVLNAQPTTAEISFINSSIKKSIREYITMGNRVRYIDIQAIRNKIISDNPRLVSIVPKSGLERESLFTSTHITRKYATMTTGSTRETLLAQEYTLEPEEFAVLGSVNVSIRVDV